MIEVKGLTKKDSQGEYLLREVSFSIEAGEQVFLLGRKGAGKSTLLHCLAGRSEIDAGQIIINGQQFPPADKLKLKQSITETGILYPHYQIERELSVYRNLLTGLDSHPSPAEVLGCLSQVGLREKAKVLAQNLSVDQYQRLILAKLLMAEPEVVLFDLAAAITPFNLNLLAELMSQENLTILFNINQLSFALESANRVLGMHNGQIKWDKKIAQVNKQDLIWFYHQNKGA